MSIIKTGALGLLVGILFAYFSRIAPFGSMLEFTFGTISFFITIAAISGVLFGTYCLFNYNDK